MLRLTRTSHVRVFLSSDMSVMKLMPHIRRHLRQRTCTADKAALHILTSLNKNPDLALTDLSTQKMHLARWLLKLIYSFDPGLRGTWSSWWHVCGVFEKMSRLTVVKAEGCVTLKMWDDRYGVWLHNTEDKYNMRQLAKYRNMQYNNVPI